MDIEGELVASRVGLEDNVGCVEGCTVGCVVWLGFTDTDGLLVGL